MASRDFDIRRSAMRFSKSGEFTSITSHDWLVNSPDPAAPTGLRRHADPPIAIGALRVRVLCVVACERQIFSVTLCLFVADCI